MLGILNLDSEMAQRLLTGECKLKNEGFRWNIMKIQCIYFRGLMRNQWIILNYLHISHNMLDYFSANSYSWSGIYIVHGTCKRKHFTSISVDFEMEVPSTQIKLD